MKKFLIAFAVVAVALVILFGVGQVFSQESTIREVYNAGAQWVGDTFDLTAPTIGS